MKVIHQAETCQTSVSDSFHSHWGKTRLPLALLISLLLDVRLLKQRQRWWWTTYGVVLTRGGSEVLGDINHVLMVNVSLLYYTHGMVNRNTSERCMDSKCVGWLLKMQMCVCILHIWHFLHYTLFCFVLQETFFGSYDWNRWQYSNQTWHLKHLALETVLQTVSAVLAQTGLIHVTIVMHRAQQRSKISIISMSLGISYLNETPLPLE